MRMPRIDVIVAVCRSAVIAACLMMAGGAVAGEAWVLDVKGAIGPASADYVKRGLRDAAAADAHLVVLRMDTPGGLDQSMRDIIQSILASPVPVVGFVAPNGARAASAGTYILYATHVAAMAPATNIGAATPVQIGAPKMPGMPGDEEQKPKPKPRSAGDAETPEDTAKGTEASEDAAAQSSPAPAATAMERKALNDAIAYIRGLAELRGRNVEWAESAVRDAASLSASAALEAGVIDLVAQDLEQLLAAIDGRTVRVDGREITLSTAGITVHMVETDWRNRFLATITDPNVAYILMLLGMWGLILEFYNPGAVFPGVLGGICLLLALYAFQVLPVSFAGLALLLLGIVLMIAEAMVPSFGVLGFGGVAAFVIGSIVLMDSELPAFRIAMPLIAAVSAVSAALLIFVLGMLVRARRQQVVSGVEAMIGEEAIAIEDFSGEGMARVRGELWRVESAGTVGKGERLRIQAVQGLRLKVSKSDDNEEETP